MPGAEPGRPVSIAQRWAAAEAGEAVGRTSLGAEQSYRDAAEGSVGTVAVGAGGGIGTGAVVTAAAAAAVAAAVDLGGTKEPRRKGLGCTREWCTEV